MATTAGGEVLKSSWGSLWTIISAITFAFATPYIVAKTICKIKLSRNKDTLPGKVNIVFYVIILIFSVLFIIKRLL